MANPLSQETPGGCNDRPSPGPHLFEVGVHSMHEGFPPFDRSLP